MMEAGCQSVDFGTDAASTATLRGFRKSFTVEDILAASAVCRERGLPFCHSLVFGGEGETWETVAETIAVMDACRPTAVNAMCGVRVYPETPLAATLLARGDVSSVEALYEPWFYFAPAVRDGLAEVVGEAARARGNWLLPGNKVNDEEQLFATPPRPRAEGRPLALRDPARPRPCDRRRRLAAIVVRTVLRSPRGAALTAEQLEVRFAHAAIEPSGERLVEPAGLDDLLNVGQIAQPMRRRCQRRASARRGEEGREPAVNRPFQGSGVEGGTVG